MVGEVVRGPTKMEGSDDNERLGIPGSGIRQGDLR